nr:MAG TPA: hypothetical protein [Microviridae sp.]
MINKIVFLIFLFILNLRCYFTRKKGKVNYVKASKNV